MLNRRRFVGLTAAAIAAPSIITSRALGADWPIRNVRIVVPMLGPVPIALDFGFPIVKSSTDNTQVFNFWMGFFR